jgi:hypothetical protein
MSTNVPVCQTPGCTTPLPAGRNRRFCPACRRRRYQEQSRLSHHRCRQREKAGFIGSGAGAIERRFAAAKAWIRARGLDSDAMDCAAWRCRSQGAGVVR